MEKSQFEELKNGVQEIIDLIAAKDNKSANNKLLEVSDKLDEFLDHTDEDEDLIEISRYQVLLNQLFQKINPEEEGE
jgi:predicted RND superfamily exporter protein